MKVIIHPGDRDGASAKYRLLWPAEELQKQGHDIEIVHDLPYRTLRYESPFGYDSIVGLDGAVEGDVVVIQRPRGRDWYELMLQLQQRGIAVVIELDDAFHCIPRHNPVAESWDPIKYPNHTWKWLEKACSEADWVTCTTSSIADHYAPHGRVSIIPNYVPRWYTQFQPAKASRNATVIGWAGAVMTHRLDLQVTKGAVRRVMDSHAAELAIVGTGKGVSEALKVEDFSATGWVDIERYAKEMALFDVGIVPLKMITFNQSKSWLKTIEMASLGVACISSPTEDNVKAAELGLCKLAASPEEWEELLSEFILGPNHRDEFARNARQQVADHLILEDHADEWLSAWQNAYDVRRGGVEIEEGLAAASHG